MNTSESSTTTNALSVPLVETLHALRAAKLEAEMYRHALGELARSLHQEIRLLEARNDRLREELREFMRSVIDNERTVGKQKAAA